MDKLLAKFIDKYELEIRFHLLQDNWLVLYETIAKISTENMLETSISLITKDTQRRELHFVNGVKKSDKFMDKRHIEIYKVKSEWSYKISLTHEMDIAEFSNSAINNIRFKIRNSFITPDFVDWRFDFTYVKTLPSNHMADIPKIKGILFPATLTGKKYLDHVLAQMDYQSKLEFEVEFLGKTAPSQEQIHELINHILNIIKPGYSQNKEYHTTLFKIAEMLLSNQGSESYKLYKFQYGLKQLVNQPKTFSADEYHRMILPNIEHFYLSDKADGDRCVIYAQKQGKTYIISADQIVDITGQVNTLDHTVILDAEVMGLDVEKDASFQRKFERIYLFDCMYFDDKISNKPFSERMTHLESIAKTLGKTIDVKPQIKLTQENYKKIIPEFYNKKHLYPIDGLIFTPETALGKSSKHKIADDYFDMNVYKWKPAHQLTIDFLVMRAPSKILGIKPYVPKDQHEIYFLFCGIRLKTFELLNLERVSYYNEIFADFKFNKDYFPIQFSPAVNPYAYIYYHPLTADKDKSNINLHGHIAEFGYNCVDADSSCEWQLVKMRPDKDIDVVRGAGFGNDFHTAEATYQMYSDPITLDTLIGKQNTGDNYFKTTKAEIYKPLTKFNNFVKAQLIRQLEHMDWVIDMASGQGANLFDLNGFGIKNILSLDIDKNAIAELNKRKYDLDKADFYVYTKRPAKHASIYTKVVDLTEPVDKINELIREDIPIHPAGANAIILNFAIHYLIKSPESLANFVKLIDSLLMPGGKFIFTTFNGTSIFNLLKDVEPGKSWDLHEGETLKYSIRRDFQEDRLTDFGQKIGVLHPFSQGEYYEENLINLDVIITAFKTAGYNMHQNDSFKEWLPQYKAWNLTLFKRMSDDDKKYAGLYQAVTLHKTLPKELKKDKKNKK